MNLQAGKKQIAIWVNLVQQAAIVAFLAGTGRATRNGSPIEGDHPARIKKKSDTREAWQIRNDCGKHTTLKY